MADIIFDFDGTIADSLPVAVAMFNRWTKDRGPITDEELVKLRNLPLARVLEELRVPPWRAPALVVQGRLEISKRIDSITIFKGMPEVITELKKHHKLFIMSTNSVKNIEQVLTANHLKHEFKRIYGGVSLFGKKSALRKVLRDNKLDPADCYYIGDETRDIRAAEKVGVTVISVTWGYNGKTLLASHKPDALVDSPRELLSVLSI